MIRGFLTFLMPSYPYSPDSKAYPGWKARLRAGAMRQLAGIMRGRSGQPLHAEQLKHARILVIRPDHLGDLLFLGPALRWLRARLPGAHLTLAVGPWGKPALPGLEGAYDNLIEFAFPGFERGKRAGFAERWAMLRKEAEHLQQQHFDVALICRHDHWWGAMLARFAGIPYRLGFDTKETSPWLSVAIPKRYEHAVAANLRLMAALTSDSMQPDPTQHPLRFQLTAAEMTAAKALLKQHIGERNQAPLVIIHPGSGAKVKYWEMQKWGMVAYRLALAGARVLITGSPDEVVLTRSIANQHADAVVDLGGKTSFSSLAALFKQADLVMGSDSGPLHLAVAVGTPTVHLFGPSDPVLFGPWGDPTRHVVLFSQWRCAPCGKFDWPDLAEHGCVRDISEEVVLKAAGQLLKIVV